VSITQSERPAALEHITYEWWMLWEMAVWLDGHGGLRDAEYNAHVESAAIHLRNLSQFLAKPGDSRDIRPGDFGVEWSCSPESEVELLATFERASQRVAHPSRERLKPNPGFVLGDLMPMVDAEMVRWFALVGHVPWTRYTENQVQGVGVRRAEWHWRRR